MLDELILVFTNPDYVPWLYAGSVVILILVTTRRGS